LGIKTDDLGFRVIHLVEYIDELRKKGTLKLTKPIDLRVTYHDSCSLGRLSDPWTPYKGKRGLWGVVTPPLERRRGDKGIYEQPREILRSIPGLNLVEMIRIRENALCCGAGRGTTYAFPDLAAWSAGQRLQEVKEVGAEALVSTCPWCKDNFKKAAKSDGMDLKVYDFSEIILQAMEG
jgi:Fe-S oxidoreductase